MAVAPDNGTSLSRLAFGDDARILREPNFQLLLLATVFPILGSALVSPVLESLIEPFGTGGSTIVLTTDFRAVLALRAVQGIGFAGIVPVITASIGDMYDDTAEVTGQGLRHLVNGVSEAGVPLLAGALVASAWQYPFLLYALAVPVAAVVALRFSEPTVERSEPGGAGDPTERFDPIPRPPKLR
jgi:MFS family permease